MVTRKMTVGMVVAVLVLMSGTAWATQYYVSPNGNDDANGLSWDTAFATIGKGIGNANNGDVVDVNEGTYYETIDFAGKAITVRSTDTNDWGVIAATIIDANNASADAVTFDTGEDANTVLRGLTVTGASVGVYVDSVGPVISRCILHSNGTGVKYTTNSTGTLIVNNKIHDSSGYGVFGHKGDATIKSNWIYDSDKGIELSSGASADIYNNTIVNNISYGIDKGGGQGTATISNCIIWDCNNDLEGCSATYSCISDCNDASGTGNICGDGNDPNFVDADANDFHLQPDSPCIEAGDPCYVPDSNETDIDNNARIHGLTVDISADELSSFRWYVDDDRESSGTGDSWDEAFQYLQDALANSSLKSDNEIWVAQGIYKPTTSTTDRTASFQIKAGVIVKGGYAGLSASGADRDKRDIHAYETILSGDIDGDAVLDNGNSYHVVTCTDGAVLDGFTITGGKTDADAGWEDWPDRCGGGVFCWEVSGVTIKNCLIIDNKARYNMYHGYGGGVFNYKSSVTVENCFFINNTGDKGGGMANKECSETVTVTNCVFSGNYASRDGGGIYNEESISTLINCTFSKNHTEGSGGGVQEMVYSSNTTVTNCIFWGNTGSAGFYIQVMQLLINDSSVVKYSCIQDEDPDDTSIPFGGAENNNTDDNPRFVDADNPAGPDGIFGTFDDGLRVKPDSNCVDSGDNDVVITEDITEDIIGNTRIIDGDCSGCDPEVDMGAYELPRIWYVDHEGDDSDGKSWATAFKELRDAIDTLTAAEIADGNEIWVAEGTYKPDGGTDRDASFTLIGGVPIRGGYAGYNETDPCEQNFLAYETILSGDIDGDNILDDKNSRHVVTGTNGAILEGFTITEGYAYGYAENNYGGGIYCNSASPTISSCVIKGNNSSEEGGGIYCNNASPVINNCKIIGNEASRNGGGIYCFNASPTVRNCVFRGNKSALSAHYEGGGGMYNTNSNPSIINCVFSRNMASSVTPETPMGDGGGIYNKDSSPDVINCIFWGNFASHIGGGMYNFGLSFPRVINCVFADNYTGSYAPSCYSYGGGMGNQFDDSGVPNPTVTNCTFSGNYATEGGGMWSDSGTNAEVTNCIFWGNYGETAEPNGISPPSGINVSFSDVKGGYIGISNIDSDPCFIDAGDPLGPDGLLGTWDDGLRIMAYSPCVDKASDTVADFPETDITGRGRVDVPYTENDESPADMGAYESPIVWFVDDDASNAGGRDGRSWKEAEAFKYLRDALDDSVNTYLAAGDEIWVASGTYYADQNSANPAPTGSDSRSDTFQLVEGVDVYGGFAGEMTGSQRSDPTAYETILSGDIDGDPVLDDDNSYHVVTHVVTGDYGVYNAKLDGFTIKGGNANGSSVDNWGGGGIYCCGASPTISNCVIRDNKAGSYGGGGGLCIYDPGSPMVRNCFFIDNIAPYGGAMYNKKLYVTVENCVFSGNDSSQNGGGIYNDLSFSTLINCTFSENHAEGSGGGMYNNNYRTWQSTVTNCIFWGNSDSDGEGESAQITGSGAVVNYSCIQGDWTGDGGIGNTDQNPLFVGAPVAYWKMDDSAANPWVAGLNGVPTERVNNGTFDDDSEWVFQQDWHWHEFTLTARCSSPFQGYLSQVGVVESEKKYAVVFDVLENSGDMSLEVLMGGATIATVTEKEKTYVKVGTAGVANNYLQFHLASATGLRVRIDNVSAICLDDFPLTGILYDDVNYYTSDHNVAGKINEALEFDGINDYVDCGNDSSLDITGPVTICAWLDPNKDSAYQGIVTKCDGDGTTNNPYEFRLSNDAPPKLQIVRADSSSSDTATSTGTVSLGDGWHHAAVTVDSGGNVAFYIDGQPSGTATLTVTSPQGNNNSCLVAKRDDGLFFEGKIDDVIIFDRALSPGEIEKLFERGSNGKAYDLAAGGPDGIFGTWDDGLRLMADSNCIDAADGDVAPSFDILGYRRVDMNDVNNTGGGEPNYVDMGAYESGPAVVVMCWIDESTLPEEGTYVSSEGNFNFDLFSYRDVINSPKLLVVKSGCLVPALSKEDWTLVLPEGYPYDPNNPPEGITVEDFNRPDDIILPDFLDVNEFIADFDRIRDGIVPDYLCLSVDNSAGMTTDTINPYYGDPALDYPYDKFITWLDDTYSISVNNGNLIRRDKKPPLAEFENERWVDEMKIQIQNVVDGL